MKKNFIYTLCILLSGAMFLGSCEDMLEADSKRVDYDFNKLELNDSVYSVLGILKNVQNVADRYVLLGELRGDLVVPVKGKAVTDIQELCDFSYDTESPYLAAKDYYGVINNCNVFLSRVDTTIERANKKLMLREFVAVKSIRAWAYLQLAINYNRVPYFTEPILTHSAATEVMANNWKSRDEIVSLLIDELTPYENPRVYPMPEWSGVTTGGGTSISTRKLFMPIRALLGELHLWRGLSGDYKMAANYFYKSIMQTPELNSTSYEVIYDHALYSEWNTDKPGNSLATSTVGLSLGFASMTVQEGGQGQFVIPMMSSTSAGTISGLVDIFAPEVVGAAQVNASPGYVALSNRQDYCYYDKEEGISSVSYNPSTKYLGDLRRYSYTGSQVDFMSEDNTTYDNVIGKLHYTGSSSFINNMQVLSTRTNTEFVQIYRKEHLYARFAEALIGMAVKDNYNYGALQLAMDVLKNGVSANNYVASNFALELVADTVYGDDGNPLLNSEGGDSILYAMEEKYADLLEFDFTVLANSSGEKLNHGMHSGGSGESEYNSYYGLSNSVALSDSLDLTNTLDYILPDEQDVYNIANYYGVIVEETDSTFKTSRDITKDDYVNYITDLLIDELALEFCFEGNRFGDLIRFAKMAESLGHADWKDVLAKRVAGREHANAVSYRNESNEFEYSSTLYNLLLDENNWYLPLPGSIDVETPEDYETETEGSEE